MTERPSFHIDAGALRAKPKAATAETTRRVDEAGEAHGFVDRAPKGKRGRPASPRTGQVHAKVFPQIADEIAQEATARGVTQGVLIEEAWKLYRAQRGR